MTRGHTWPQKYLDTLMGITGSPYWIVIGYNKDGDPILSEKYPQRWIWEDYLR